MFRRDLKPAVSMRWAGALAVAGMTLASPARTFAGITAANDVTQPVAPVAFTSVQTSTPQINQYSFTLPSEQIATTAFNPNSINPALFNISSNSNPATVASGTSADAGDLLAMQDGVGALADFNDGVVIQSVRPGVSTTRVSEGATAIPLLPAAWSGISGLLTVMGLTMSRRVRRAMR